MALKYLLEVAANKMGEREQEFFNSTTFQANR